MPRRSCASFGGFSLLVLGLSALAAPPASALNVTLGTTMSVSANVLNACAVISVPTLSLAGLTYSSSGSALQTNGQISVLCTVGTAYHVQIDNGQASGATPAARVLKGPAGNNSTLTYGLYRDSSYSQVWGATVGTNTLDETATGLNQSWPVYMQLASGVAMAPAGAYSDTVTVTVSY